MNDSARRKQLATGMVAAAVPLAQKINDQIFTSGEFKLMRADLELLVGLITLSGAWARMCDLQLWDLHMLVEAAYENTEARSKPAPPKEPGPEPS